MKVILLGELKGKGGEGDIVEVARGFAVNYLLPQKRAVEATPGNLKQLEARRHKISAREEVRLSDADSLKSKLDGLTVTIPARVGEEGQLFGSVTAAQIADALAEMGIEVDRKRIDLHHAIRQVGEHPAQISIYREIKAVLNVKVVDETNPDGTPSEADPEEVVVEGNLEVGSDGQPEIELEQAESAADGSVTLGSETVLSDLEPVSSEAPIAPAPAAPVPVSPATPAAE
jgi:large subunit ribosomal protein L9